MGRNDRKKAFVYFTQSLLKNEINPVKPETIVSIANLKHNTLITTHHSWSLVFSLWSLAHWLLAH